MRKTLSILFSILSLTLIAQVPQGVGYQGVATDANGIELVNQSISIRASVLSGSATGTIEWEETHATSTDTFGLFTLTIGQGTNTTNGAQTSFADISWGTNTHFLKIEMDVTGGSNYSFMGTNQMMSVPYALYAESANINYDSISNLLSNDSTFITTVSGGMGGGGCDFLFPEGINGDPISFNPRSNPYTVPPGKRLYILQSEGPNVNNQTSTAYFIIDGTHVVYSNTVSSAGVISIVNENQIVSSQIGYSEYINGLLVDISVNLEPISLWNGGGIINYTVPANKELIILGTYFAGNLIIDNINTNLDNSDNPFILSGLQTLTSTGGGSVLGYLVDENYFAGCGGGGSSTSTSSLDSTTIANMIAGAGGGCDFLYPEGLDGDAITATVSSADSFQVPSNKKLYLLGWNNYSPVVNGIHLNTNNFPIILNPGDALTNDNNTTSKFNGYLVDENYFAGCGGGGSSSTTINYDSLQTLTLNNDTLSISGGNSVVLPASGLSLVNSVNTYNTSLSSGSVGGGSYSSTQVIDTLYILANTMVEISGFFTVSMGNYTSGGGQVYCQDLTGSQVSFHTVSEAGVSASSLSSGPKTGLFIMKKFFTNATTIIIYASLSASQCCHAWQSGAGGSFVVNSIISIDKY